MDKKKTKVTEEKQEELQKTETTPGVSQQEHAGLKTLAEQLETNYKRALADYQNLQRRTQEEKAGWIKFAGQSVLLKLLPVLDTLMLAQKHNPDQGLNLSITQFLDVLKQEGVEKIDTLNKVFDPQLMECVDTQEGEDGKILAETRAGYLLQGQVLRPAQVKVGKAQN